MEKIKLEEAKKLSDTFLKENFKYRRSRKTRKELLRRSLQSVSNKGLHLEFGVWKGESINYLANLKPDQVFHGFDSFKGLPEDWSKFYPKGWMALEKRPKVLKNVKLHVGLFQDTLHRFLKTHFGGVAYVHLDADLYSSTKYALFKLADRNRIREGTIIEFDELFYQDSPDTALDDEHRVLLEFLETYDVDVEWLWFFRKRVTTRATLMVTNMEPLY